jgi:hypothetical protein
MFCGPLSGPRPASESNSGVRKRVNITLLFVTLNSGELVLVPMDAAAETFITFLCNDINFLGNNRQQRSDWSLVLSKSDGNIFCGRTMEPNRVLSTCIDITRQGIGCARVSISSFNYRQPSVRDFKGQI